MKKILICSLICCSLFLTGCGSSNKEVKEKINEEELSSKFFDNQTIDTLEVQNFNISVENNESYISFNLKNTSNDNVNVEYIKISLYDANDILIYETYGHVGGSLAGKQIKLINIAIDIDLSKTAKVSFARM